jgi:hypothetical protein
MFGEGLIEYDVALSLNIFSASILIGPRGVCTEVCRKDLRREAQAERGIHRHEIREKSSSRWKMKAAYQGVTNPPRLVKTLPGL